MTAGPDLRILRRGGRLFGIAVLLLTRIPVRVDAVTDDEVRAAAVLHPLVGCVVAAAGIGVRAVTEHAVGRTGATILAMSGVILLTGALHEDGLADSTDGIWGGSTPQRRIEIMRDSSIGTFGATALFLVLALRLALLAPLDLAEFARATLAGHVIGRAASVALAGTLPAASAEGLGSRFIGPVPAMRWTVLTGSAVAVGAVAVGWWWIVTVIGAGLVVAGARALAKARLDGLTGDVLGAVNVLAELTTLLLVVGHLRAGSA